MTDENDASKYKTPLEEMKEVKERLKEEGLNKVLQAALQPAGEKFQAIQNKPKRVAYRQDNQDDKKQYIGDFYVGTNREFRNFRKKYRPEVFIEDTLKSIKILNKKIEDKII